VPSALSLLTTTFTGQKDRGRAFGIYGAIAGAGGAVGLLLGGVLTQYLSLAVDARRESDLRRSVAPGGS
jgi:MFS family permease